MAKLRTSDYWRHRSIHCRKHAFRLPVLHKPPDATYQYYFEDATLANHTIYQPKDPSKVGTKLPVIAWANGGCSQDGISFASFLAQVASHGALAIAVGTIKGIPNTGAPPGSGSGGMSIWPERQRAAIDWAVKNAGKGNYTHVDATRIAVWGQSCGGVESYANWNDSRVNSIGIFHSGLMSEAETKSTAGKINKPVFYFLGGPNDIAYKNVGFVQTDNGYGLLIQCRASATMLLFRRVRRLGLGMMRSVMGEHSISWLMRDILVSRVQGTCNG
jgi:hypothetical protein